MSAFLAMWAGWAAACLIFIAAMLRWRRVAVAVTSVAAILVLVFGQLGPSVDLFVRWKTATVLFATCTWAVGMGLWRYPYISTLASVVLGANILEVAVSELAAGNTLNGLMVAITALCCPAPRDWREAPHGQIGFETPLWVWANLSTFIYFYLFNSTINHLWAPTVTVLVIPALAVLWARDGRVWMAWRMYGLGFFIVQYNLWPGIEARLAPEPATTLGLQAMRDSPAPAIHLALSGVLTLALARQRWRELRRRPA